MSKRLPYEAWVRLEIDKLPEEEKQGGRGAYYSTNGRIAKWETYRAYCKANGHQYDGPPDGYWESKEEWWHKPIGLLSGLVGVFVWFMLLVISGSTGMRKGK